MLYPWEDNLKRPEMSFKVGKKTGFISIAQPSGFYWENPGFTRVYWVLRVLLGNKHYESHPTPSS